MPCEIRCVIHLNGVHLLLLSKFRSWVFYAIFLSYELNGKPLFKYERPVVTFKSNHFEVGFFCWWDCSMPQSRLASGS